MDHTAMSERTDAFSFVSFILPEVLSEAAFTEQNDPDHDHGNEGTLGDYLADLHRRIGRMLGHE